MKVAVTSTAPGPDGSVPEYFAGSPYLLIIDSRYNKILHNIPNNGDDTELAREVLRHDCECVLCGPIEEAPFLIIADEGQVTRYNAAGKSVEEALDDFEQNLLELIRDHIGGQGCESTRSHAEQDKCHGNHHH